MALEAAWLVVDEAILNDASEGEKGLYFWLATVAQMNDEAGRVSYIHGHFAIADTRDCRCRQDPNTSSPSVGCVLRGGLGYHVKRDPAPSCHND